MCPRRPRVVSVGPTHPLKLNLDGVGYRVGGGIPGPLRRPGTYLYGVRHAPPSRAMNESDSAGPQLPAS